MFAPCDIMNQLLTHPCGPQGIKANSMTFGAHTAQLSLPRPADRREAGGERWQPLNSSLARWTGEGGRWTGEDIGNVAVDSISSSLKTTSPEVSYGR
jgi:hypothetical protein